MSQGKRGQVLTLDKIAWCVMFMKKKMNPRANHSGARARCQLRGFLYKSSLNGFSVIESSQIEEIFTYILLNIPVACPPRATFLGQP
jgi:hypothetical protein